MTAKSRVRSMYTTVSEDYSVTVYRSLKGVVEREFSRGEWFLDDEATIPCTVKSLRAALVRPGATAQVYERGNPDWSARVERHQ